jgi:hypothetical protein
LPLASGLWPLASCLYLRHPTIYTNRFLTYITMGWWTRRT